MTQSFKHIVIRMPNWLGDAVMATPILQDIKIKWPDAHLTALCQGSVGHLLAGNPFIDEVVFFPRHNPFLWGKEKKKIFANLRSRPFDLGILLTNSFSSAWMLWRGQVAKRLGFATDGRKFLLTDPISIPSEKGKEHLVTTYKRLLLPLGISLSTSSPHLVTSTAEKLKARNLLKSHGIEATRSLVGINPGAAFGSAKCWPPERFRAVAEKLLQKETAVLFFGDPTGTPLVNDICKDLPPQAINLAGKTSLRELIALIETCDVFLTNDSGPMHIAAALKVPLVSLFGSTNEVATGPYQHGTILHKHVECSPCYRRTCPIDFRCMKRIEVEEVLTALENQYSIH